MFLTIPICFFSQITISGKVSFKNKGIKNVNVTLKDTYDGATTDAEGKYSFETSEKGNHQLIFENQDYYTIEKSIIIENQPITENIEIKEKVSEINAVVISVGSIEASDKKCSTAALTPMDIYNTAGANATMSEGYKFLPGVQKTGESTGLFVRGGTGTETKFYMDGNLVNNFFSESVPGIPGHDRFNTNIFKGSSFSSGGYSALYGQALSAILVLESIDLPEKSSLGAFIFPFSASGDFQKLNRQKTASFGLEVKYFNMSLMEKILNFNTDFIHSPKSFGFNGNFRQKFKNGGFLKYYGSFDANSVAVSQHSLENNYDENQPSIKGSNTFHSLNYRQKFGKYTLNVGSSFSVDHKNLTVGILNQNQKIGDVAIKNIGTYFNQKTVLERKFANAGNIKTGFELQYSDDIFINNQFGKNAANQQFKNLITAIFGETNLAISTRFSVSGGLRAEHSSFLNQWNLAPRLAAAYKLSPVWVTSFAYGKFFQTPDAQFLNQNFKQPFQKADHYILQLEKNENNRTLRAEVFYKNYKNLEKSVVQNFVTLPENLNGNGFAKGFELLWNDKKSFENFTYRISYSYLDSRRNYLNYPSELFPSFASKHNLSVVTSKFISKWKTGLGASYQYASPRPSYDIILKNGVNSLLETKQSKDYNALNFSMYYLPNLGKKDAKSFTILVAGVNNILNFKNNFGYRFSQDGLRNAEFLPSSNMMFYVGLNLNFGTDKTQQTIDNL